MQEHWSPSGGLWGGLGSRLCSGPIRVAGVPARLLGAAAQRGRSLSAHPPQFPDIVEFSEAMANAGKTVIVAALDGTFQRKVRRVVRVLGWDREGGRAWAGTGLCRTPG